VNRRRLLAGGGVAAVLAGAVLAAVGPSGTGSMLADAAVVAVGLAGGLVVLWMLWTDAGAAPAADDPVAWADVGPLTEQSPERTPSEYPLSTRSLSATLEQASQRARSERHPDAGLAVVRGQLRETLVAALVAGGTEREAAIAAIEAGTWTDDPVAAGALSEAYWPSEPLRQRLRNWLFPGEEVRRRTRRAVAEIATVGDDEIPAVVGHDAPRRVPVRPPTLAEQERGADGELQPAAPAAVSYRWRTDGTADADVDGRGESQ